jgi:hypothetical protein
MGCCLFASVLAGAPRIAFLVYWLFRPNAVTVAFSSFLWPLLGFLFLPWTTLTYVLVFPGGIVWFDWLFLGLAVALDIGSYGGGAYSNKRRTA